MEGRHLLTEQLQRQMRVGIFVHSGSRVSIRALVAAPLHVLTLRRGLLEPVPYGPFPVARAEGMMGQ